MLALLQILWFDVNEWNRNMITTEFIYIVLPITIFAYFRMENDYIGLAKLVKWTLLFIAITSILTIIVTYYNPMIVRNIIGSASQSTSQQMEDLGYKKFGVGGYGFATAIVSLFPMLIYYYKNNDRSPWGKKTLLLFMVIVYFSLIKIQIFANILIATTFIILSLIGKKKFAKSWVYISVVLLIAVLIPVQYYIDMFAYMANWFNTGSENYSKFNDMAQFLSSGGSYKDTGAGIRASRFPLNWESFTSNPLYGGQYGNGHLHWMNKLAVFGLLGTIPFVLIIYKYIKINLKYFNKEFAFYFLLSLFSIITLGAIKALSGREIWFTFFVLLPGFYYLPLLKKHKKKK